MRSSKTSRSVIAIVALLAVSVFAQWARSPTSHIRVEPGMTLPVELQVTLPVDGLEVDDGSDGKLRVTTVRVSPVDNFGLLWAKLTGAETVDLDSLGTNLSEITRDADDHIESSKHHAWAAAMRLVGHTEPGAEVLAVMNGSAAEAAGIHVGDVLVSVNDQPVTDPADLRDLIGDSDGPVKFGFANREPVLVDDLPVRDGRRLLGVVTANVVTITNPFLIDTGEIGGPSAGLMFTLAYLDAVTVGDLTGGIDVAGTGTVNDIGQVGEIGHIDMKVRGAELAGSTLFLAPASQLQQAASAAKNIEVVGVSTVADAVRALCDRGGEAAGLCNQV